MCFQKLQIEFTRQGLRAFRVDPASSRQNIIISQIFVKIALTGFFCCTFQIKCGMEKEDLTMGAQWVYASILNVSRFLEDLLAHAIS